MAGLSLNGGVGVRAGGYSSSPRPATASQAAFGSGASTSNNMPSTASALAPNDPFGVALWMAIGAAAILIWIRHGLPG